MKNNHIIILVVINLILTLFIASYLIFSNPNNSVSNCQTCKDHEIDMVGYVKSITKTTDGITMLVEDNTKFSRYDKASVKVNKDTTIIKTVYSRTFAPEEINVGDKVQIIFDGPVAESYPVQGTASFVWIIESNVK